jgi:hypothetical protein
VSADYRANHFKVLTHLLIEDLLLGGEVIPVLAGVDLLIVFADSVNRTKTCSD